MSQRSRVEKMLEKLRPLVERKQRRIQTKLLTGESFDAAMQAVVKAVAATDMDLLEAILAQVAEIDALPPRPLHSGKTYKETHGFLQWAELVRRGHSALPTRIPRALLQCWVDDWQPRRPDRERYGMDGRPHAPVPLNRCADCETALPNGGRIDRERGPSWIADGCPVCGSHRFACCNLAYPIGTVWHEPRNFKNEQS